MFDATAQVLNVEDCLTTAFKKCYATIISATFGLDDGQEIRLPFRQYVESLPIKVMLEGKPLEGALFKIADAKDPKKKTGIKKGKAGKAGIPIQKAGPQLIVAKLKRPLKDDPHADTLSISTRITFEVK